MKYEVQILNYAPCNEVVLGSGGIVSCSLISSLEDMNGQLQRKSPQYPLHGAGWAKIQFEEQKKALTLPLIGARFLSHPAHSSAM
jgi:hypothetical protein